MKQNRREFLKGTAWMQGAAMRMLFVLVFALVLVRAALGDGCPASIDWDAAPEIARGMKYVHIALDEPRRMENFLVRIDLHAPGLRVASSGRAPNWGAVMDDYTNSVMLVDVRRQRTRDFLEERRAHGTNMVLAVNTSPWGPWRPPYTHKHGRFSHLTVSAGEVVSHSVTRGEMLVIFTNNVAVITNALDDALLPSVAAAHPGHGDNIILRGGVSTVRPRKPNSLPKLAPRTVIGISADGRWLYALVVDGRQPGYSMGAEMSDLVKLMLAAGAADAINMDGGGSATLAWWDAERQETVIPNRHGPRFLGYRPVAMNLGFYFE